MKALIYAAGLGTRLRPLTNHCPKALVLFRGKPLLAWAIENLLRAGVTQIMVNTHHLHEQIEGYLKTKPYPIPVETCYEPEILGTGGGLYNLRAFWGEEDFLVCNADILSDYNLQSLLSSNTNLARHHVTLAVNDVLSNSMLLVDQEQTLCGWQKDGVSTFYREPVGDTRAKGFTGFHRISPSVFEIQVGEIPFSVIDYYFKLVEVGALIKVVDIGGAFWMDLGTPAALIEAERTFPIE